MDPWFLDEYTVNPYSGCSFNCLFCYIRGSKYGEHMQEKVSIKQNAVELLNKQLALQAKKNAYGFIVLSSATDPYLHFEEKEKLTRGLLEVILKHRFPVHVITRSALVQRDFDLLKQIAAQAVVPQRLKNQLKDGCLVTFSFSTLDDAVAGVFEPGATPPSQRLKTLQAAVKEGLYTGVSMMPLLPYISDTSVSLEDMFAAFQRSGARYVMPADITLFGEAAADSKTLVMRAVKHHYPHLLLKYEQLFANSHQLPAFYRKAFYEKMKELSARYQMPDRIVPAHLL